MIASPMNRKKTDKPLKSDVFSARDLNRALLSRQMLMQRGKMPAAKAIEKLVGMQAQLPNSPYVGLWSRLVGFHQSELGDLYEKRRVVRLAMMRSTIHLVTDSDCLALRPVVQPAIDRSLKGAHGRHLADIDTEELTQAGRDIVNSSPATFSDLGKELNIRWPDRHPDIMRNAIRALVPLVQVTPRGIWGKTGPAAHTTVENWLGQSLASDGTVAGLVMRYLAAFGPASVIDAQAWSGLTRLGSVFEDLRPRLLSFRDEKNRELFDLPNAPRPAGDLDVPVRFLPEFDNVLLAYKDRSRIIADKYRPLVYPTNGMIQPTVLVDGFVEAKWKVRVTAPRATLYVESFRRLSKTERQAIKDEGALLLNFLAPETKARDIRVSGL
jgi:hypothetical protein